MTKNDVIQFTENHKWCGCLGIISEDKGEGHPRRYMHISLMMGLVLSMLARHC